MAIFDDPLMIGILAAVLLFFFFVYLMIRRTVQGFQEGMNQGRR